MNLRTHFHRLTGYWHDTFHQTRTAVRAVAMATGLLCGVGRRTVSRALGFLGKEQCDWSADYRLFSRSPWEAEELFEPLLLEAIARYLPDGPLGSMYCAYTAHWVT